MNIETVKQEYMTMYDSLKRKIEDELKKFTYSTFFVDSQSFDIVDNIIKTDVSALFDICACSVLVCSALSYLFWS